jgi:hypothetical protein
MSQKYVLLLEILLKNEKIIKNLNFIKMKNTTLKLYTNIKIIKLRNNLENI